MAGVLDCKTGICCVLVLIFHLGHSAAVSDGRDADGAQHDLDKRSSDWENEAAAAPAGLKRGYHNFRFDFGKRGWSPNRYDLGKRFGYKLGEDLGAKTDHVEEADGLGQVDNDVLNQAEPPMKRGLGQYRFDFGKRGLGQYRFDFGKRYKQFKYADFDLGKREAEKRRYGQYMLRGMDLGKRAYRYDLSNKRMLRLDLGKRSADETIHKSSEESA